MTTIFISYRRLDTGSWAELLYDKLAKGFEKNEVFIDNASIRAGTNYEESINDNLNNCNVLLALIGPNWLNCLRQDGSRRLDAPDDWVRQEISTAIQRKIPILPILLGNAKFPDEKEFPDIPELQCFCKQHASKSTFPLEHQDQWDANISILFEEIDELIFGKSDREKDYGPDEAALHRMKCLMSTPEMLKDGILIKEGIRQYSRQLKKMELYKKLHDIFHNIEGNILRTIQEQGHECSLNLLKIQFDNQSDHILECLQNSQNEIDSSFQDSVKDQLNDAIEAFRTATEILSKKNHALLIAALNNLLGVIPSQLNDKIVNAAQELKSNPVTELMEKLQSKVCFRAATQSLTESKPSIAVVAKFLQQNNELAQRVNEHASLQRFDSNLRAICLGQTEVSENLWEKILNKECRKKLDSPVSPELNRNMNVLITIEKEITKALIEKNKKNINRQITNYFKALVNIFRYVDTDLKEFCYQLSISSEELNKSFVRPE